MFQLFFFYRFESKNQATTSQKVSNFSTEGYNFPTEANCYCFGEVPPPICPLRYAAVWRGDTFLHLPYLRHCLRLTWLL